MTDDGKTVMKSPLEQSIRQMIEARGWITIAQLMTLASQYPALGYYQQNPALGAEGDFITAPEISQIFGEMIAACLAQHWSMIGGPASPSMIEAGPGRGTMMSDMVRTFDSIGANAFTQHIHLIESNATLKSQQAEALRKRQVTWHDSLSELSTAPDGPAYVVANEFFDALPVRQFLLEPNGWSEIVVSLTEGKLTFTPMPIGDALAQSMRLNSRRNGLEYGSIVEVGPEREQQMALMAALIERQGGAALIIDYGAKHASMFGNSLQAIRRHQKAHVLEDLGDSDLTSLVDFGALFDAVRSPNLRFQGPVDQTGFLDALGGRTRLDMLCRGQPDDRSDVLAKGYQRLTDPASMGAFKVVAITRSDQPPLAGFNDEG